MVFTHPGVLAFTTVSALAILADSRSVALRKEDVRIELDRYVIAYNRLSAKQLGPFYAPGAKFTVPGPKTLQGRHAIVRLFEQRFASGVISLSVDKVRVAVSKNGAYVTSGMFVIETEQNGSVTEVTGTFSFTWRFFGARPLVVRQVTRL